MKKKELRQKISRLESELRVRNEQCRLFREWLFAELIKNKVVIQLPEPPVTYDGIAERFIPGITGDEPYLDFTEHDKEVLRRAKE